MIGSQHAYIRDDINDNFIYQENIIEKIYLAQTYELCPSEAKTNLLPCGNDKMPPRNFVSYSLSRYCQHMHKIKNFYHLFYLSLDILHSKNVSCPS